MAVSATYRNANRWWRSDRGGARIDDLGRENLEGTPTDHLAVTPPGGVRFDAWFDARTHLLLQIAAPQLFLKTRKVYSDYQPEGGVLLPHRILVDSGAGEAGYEHLILRILM